MIIDKNEITQQNIDEIIALAVKKACIYEVNAPKVGNVNLMNNFNDVVAEDFHKSAAAIAEPLSNVAQYGVGKTIEEAIKATRNVVNSNTNLGIVLLLTPLAMAFHRIMEKDCVTMKVHDCFLRRLRLEVEVVLNELTVEDTICVYRAIRYASPGGLGSISDYDVTKDDAPNISLKEAMTLSADRDIVARQYINNFSQIFDDGIKFFINALASDLGILEAIAQAHLMILSSTEDTLICRKLGSSISAEAKRLAQEAVVRGGFYTPEGIRYVLRYDQWLRNDGHKRNPGSTADIIAAVVFVYFLEKICAGDIALASCN